MDIDVIVERKSFDVELEVGNPVVEVKAPDHYNGPFDIFPSDEDQIIPVKEKMPVEDICVKGITGEKTITENGTYNTLEDKAVTVDVNPDLRSLTIDTLTQHGTFLPTGDGFSQVTAEEDWDEILYPVTDETDQFYDLKVFNSKNISIKAGDRLIVEGLGRGVWSAFAGGTPAEKRGDIVNRISISFLYNNVFTHARYEFVFPTDVTYVLAGYEWSGGTGVHSSNGSYCFYGEYLKYKIIRAS